MSQLPIGPSPPATASSNSSAPPADFNPATDIAQQVYTSVPELQEISPAAPSPTMEVFEQTESEPAEITEIQSQPKPAQSRAEHGYSIV